MNQLEFKETKKYLLDKCQEIMDAKQPEYTQKNIDILNNFKCSAKFIGIEPMEVLNNKISIMDNRKKNGGVRQGAGRPKKADELKLIEKLDSLIDNDEVIKTLGRQVLKGDSRAMSLYFGYRYGKPKESVDITSSEGFNVNFKDLIKFK